MPPVKRVVKKNPSIRPGAGKRSLRASSISQRLDISNFHPRSIFLDSTKGAIYDYDDFAYLYQKADGSVPFTALEQPVGLMLDKRYGGAVGDDIKATGAAGLQGSATAATYNTSTGVGTVSRTDVTNQSFVKFTVTAGRFYAVSLTNTGANNVLIRDISGSVPTAIWASVAPGSSFNGIALAPSGLCLCANAGTASFTVNSVRELPGLHAYQSTDAARPVLSARYNLLTYSEVFSNAAWTRAAVNAFGSGSVANTTATTDPLGGNTADFIQESTAAASVHGVNTTATISAGATYTLSCCFKADTRSVAYLAFDSTGGDGCRAYFNLSTGAKGTATAIGAGAIVSSDIESLGNGWYRCRVTGRAAAPATSVTARLSMTTADGSTTYTGNGTSGLYIWGADLRLTADANSRLPAYQRVTTATDYDSAGFPRFLRIDATDDFMQTASVDPGTDKVFVCAGVTKMTDSAGAAMVVESSSNGNTTPGAFALRAPHGTGGTTYAFYSSGTAFAAKSQAGFAAPNTSVVSGTGDISGDSCGIRINGTSYAPTTTDQGTGNYTAQPLYIGARAGTSLRLNNGRIYPMVICFKLPTADEIAATETWSNRKTKAY